MEWKVIKQNEKQWIKERLPTFTKKKGQKTGLWVEEIILKNFNGFLRAYSWSAEPLEMCVQNTHPFTHLSALSELWTKKKKKGRKQNLTY